MVFRLRYRESGELVMDARDAQVARESVRPRAECPSCRPGEQGRREWRIVVEGVQFGRPFREFHAASGEREAQRLLAGFEDRIEDPPSGGLLSEAPTILRAELREREVTPWVLTAAVGHEPVVDAWLASDRHKLHDMDDVRELSEPVVRRDRYTIVVEGQAVRASEEQEQRIRALSVEERALFVRVMGGLGA